MPTSERSHIEITGPARRKAWAIKDRNGAPWAAGTRVFADTAGAKRDAKAFLKELERHAAALHREIGRQ